MAKSVLIERPFGKPIVRNDEVTIVRVALENAVSVAGTLLLTEATLTIVPEPPRATSAGAATAYG